MFSLFSRGEFKHIAHSLVFEKGNTAWRSREKAQLWIPISVVFGNSTDSWLHDERRSNGRRMVYI
jgi:hypothetical protein